MAQATSGFAFVFLLALLVLSQGASWKRDSNQQSTGEDQLESEIMGAEASFSFSFQSDNQVYSPTLIRSRTTSHMIIKYAFFSNESEAAKLSYRESCLSDSIAKQEVAWMTETLNSSEADVNVKCLQIFDYDGLANEDKCELFQVVIKAEVLSGELIVHEFDFGSDSICPTGLSQSADIETAECNFAEGDCGFRNDACGLNSWKITPVDPITGKVTNSGTPLLIKQSRKECNFSLCIPCIRSSLFKEIATQSEKTSKTPTEQSHRAVRYSAPYVLALYPQDNPKTLLAFGVFRTPSYTLHPNNSILHFTYTLFQNGRHQIIVAAQCESPKSKGYIRLGKDPFDEFRVDNFEMVGHSISGQKCLDIHTNVKKAGCTKFYVIFPAAASQSPLTIDEVKFSKDLESVYCYSLDNK